MNDHVGAGAVAEIDPSALVHNLAVVRRRVAHSRVLAVIKADAYGHGLLCAARALAAADGFVVARMAEAEALRGAGFFQRVLLLPGAHSRQELERAAAARIDLVVHSFDQIEMLEQAPAELALGVWLKVDSGMHRLGIAPESVADAFARAQRAPSVKAPVRLMTHLADADEPSLGTTDAQLHSFERCSQGIVAERSIANSAGILAWPESHCDWVRPGIMLYGVSPFAGETGSDRGLRPAMGLRSMLMAVKQVSAGSAIGYGGAQVYS